MKPLKWTKADKRRAEKMGWYLLQEETRLGWAITIHARFGGAFTSDAEAREWVLSQVRTWDQLPYHATCRKAVLLCMGASSK